MSWSRIDSGFWRHPKFEGWTPAQKWALGELFGYCCEYRTDGIVPNDLSLLPRSITQAFINKAIASGWIDVTETEENTSKPAKNPGLTRSKHEANHIAMTIHDWHIYHPREPGAVERMRRNRAIQRQSEANNDRTQTEQQTNSSVSTNARVTNTNTNYITSSSSTEDPQHPPPNDDDALTNRLRRAGTTDGRIAILRGRGALELAVAWLAFAEADPSVVNPGAYAFSMAETGTPLPVASGAQGIAAGAQGTRSVQKAGVDCPHCGIRKSGPVALAEHVADVHYDVLESSPVAAIVALAPAESEVVT